MISPRSFEYIASSVNDNSDLLPKGRGRCFDIGSNGGCGFECAAFIDGECGEPQEVSLDEIISHYGKEEGMEIASKYSCFEVNDDE